jgi:hypothetical protein
MAEAGYRTGARTTTSPPFTLICTVRCRLSLRMMV